MSTAHQKRSQRKAPQNQQGTQDLLVDKTPLEGVMTATTLQLRKRNSFLVVTQRKSKRVKPSYFPTITPSPSILLGPPDAKLFISNNDISLDLTLLCHEEEMKRKSCKNSDVNNMKDANDMDDDDDTVQSSNVSSRTRSSSTEKYSCNSTSSTRTIRTSGTCASSPSLDSSSSCKPCHSSMSLPPNVQSLLCPFMSTGEVKCACAFRGNDNVPSCHDESFWFHYGHDYFRSLQEKELDIIQDHSISFACEEESESTLKPKLTSNNTDTQYHGKAGTAPDAVVHSFTCLRRSPRLHPDLSPREAREITVGVHPSITSFPNMFHNSSDAQTRYKNHMDYVQRNLRSYISLKDRSSVIDWLIDVSHDFKIPSETLSIAVGLFDRCLAVCTFVKNYKSMEKRREECPDAFILCPCVMQLLGSSCMLIATKINEINPLTVKDFCFLTENVYSSAQIIEMESEICKALRFNLHIITPKHFCNVLIRASHASNGCSPCSVSYNDLTAHMVDYLLEISMLEYNLLQVPPSKLAVAILCLARATLGQSIYSVSLEFYSGYSLNDMEDILYVLNEAHIMASRQCSDLKAVFNKYSSSDRGCVALKKALDSDFIDVLLGLD